MAPGGGTLEALAAVACVAAFDLRVDDEENSTKAKHV
jgi:hypothetical protein